MFPVGIWNNPMWKTAARAGLRRISQMVSQGNIAGANRLATTPGVLKKTMEGSQIKHLGAGMEGVSTLTAHPKRGLEVRKVIDPKGIAGPGMVANREAAGQALQHSSDVAQFRGAHTTPSGLRVQRFEYAPGKTVDQMGGAQQASAAGGMSPEARAAAQMKRLKMHGQQAGYQIADLHGGNMVMSPQGGGGKAVDFIPVPKSGNVGLNQANFQQGMHAQEMAQQGQRTPYLDYLEDPRRAGNLMARAFAGAPPLTPGSSTALRQQRGLPSAAPAPIKPTGGAGEAAIPRLSQSIQSEHAPQIGGASVGANVSTAVPQSRRRPAPQPAMQPTV